MKSDNVKILSARVEGNDRLIVELEISAPFGQFMADCAEQKPKPAVVPWEDSKIGDVVEVDGLRVRIKNADKIEGVVCSRCCLDSLRPCPCCEDDSKMDCEIHPSGCGIYFTEVKE